jgi:glycine/D-amino acid oxidase-like deaminating enzyme
VLTSKGPIVCDDLVLAAGLETMPLAAKLGGKVLLESSVGVLAHTDTRPMSLPRLAYGPGANIKQNPEGAFVTGSSFGGTPDVAATKETGEALLAQARKYVPAIGAAKLEWVSLGHRVLPKDGVSIVGHLASTPNVYVTAMHSGMSQAPLIGQLTAIEVLGGPKVDLLADFRPSRFA